MTRLCTNSTRKQRARSSGICTKTGHSAKSAVSETVIIAVAAIVAVVLIILIFACVMLKFINFKKSQNYKNVPQYDTNTFQLQSRQGSIIKAGTVDRKYANHLLPSQTSQRPSSIQVGPEICCRFKNLAVNYFTFTALHSA